MRTRVMAIPLVLGLIVLLIQENISDSYAGAGLVSSYSSWILKESNDVLIEDHIRCGLRISSRRWETTDGEPVIMDLTAGIEPGAPILAGQAVLTIRNPWAGLRYLTADARLTAERSELSALEAAARDEELAISRAAVSAARVETEKFETALARASSLYASELTSREDYELAHYNYQSAAAGLEKAQAGYSLVRAGTAGEILDAQRAEIHIREMELQEASVKAETTVLTSPIKGIVTNPESGIILCIQKTDTVLVYVPVEQEQIHKITRGARVEIKGPGGLRAVGKVTHIGHTAHAVGDRIAVSVAVMVANPDGELKPGMTVNAKIEV